jgi:hypothetical protein
MPVKDPVIGHLSCWLEQFLATFTLNSKYLMTSKNTSSYPHEMMKSKRTSQSPNGRFMTLTSIGFQNDSKTKKLIFLYHVNLERFVIVGYSIRFTLRELVVGKKGCFVMIKFEGITRFVHASPSSTDLVPVYLPIQ